jgi:hypothetical protein
MRAYGTWSGRILNGLKEMVMPENMYYVSAFQPRGVLAQYLLEPESDDGLVTWNFFDSRLRPGGEYPVRRATLIFE